MKGDNKVGYCQPPTDSRWQPGQSGNPKGRPKTRTEIVADAALILSKPVAAKTSDGREVRLDAMEAAYLALCKKGLSGQKSFLLDAIRIMLDVGVAGEKTKLEDQERKRLFQEIGAKLGLLPLDDGDD